MKLSDREVCGESYFGYEPVLRRVQNDPSFFGTPPACNVCGWVCPPLTVKAENKKAAVRLGLSLGVVAMIGVGYFLLLEANTVGWFSHDVIAVVTAKDWSIGEYRTCTEPNIAGMEEEPQIDCSNAGVDGEPKRFKVSFYGETYKEELKDKASFSWRCKKNDGTDPSFTCDDQKIIKWDENK